MAAQAAMRVPMIQPGKDFRNVVYITNHYTFVE
jgi:hypothetical protein